VSAFLLYPIPSTLNPGFSPVASCRAAPHSQWRDRAGFAAPPQAAGTPASLESKGAQFASNSDPIVSVPLTPFCQLAFVIGSLTTHR
jgi:hypothetical protein